MDTVDRDLHGRHLNVRLPGYPQFDPIMVTDCPYVRRNVRRYRAARRPFSELGEQIRKIAVDNFDHVVTVLTHDLGIRLSENLALKMLNSWLNSQAYLYTGAHLRNIPWMIAYHAESFNLYGQDLSGLPELINALRDHVPKAIIEDGRLTARSKKDWVQIEFATPRHRVIIGDGEKMTETVQMHVKDFTTAATAGDAPTLFRRTITIEPERFESLIIGTGGRRNHRLLHAARQALEAYVGP